MDTCRQIGGGGGEEAAYKKTMRLILANITGSVSITESNNWEERFKEDNETLAVVYGSFSQM